MGFFDWLFPSKKQQELPVDGYFKTLTAYAPVYRTWSGKLYESELVRSAIDARARHVSKLQVNINGSAQRKLQTKLSAGPNEIQTWSQFLYRLCTILDMQNTAFIVYVYNRYMEPTGIMTVLPSSYELVECDGVPWVRFHFADGTQGADELRNIGIMTKFQYRSEVFGETNSALKDTMSLISVQNQGIENAVKDSTSYKYIARVNNFTKPSDLAKERKRFTEENMQGGDSGILLFPNTYSDIQQIKSSAYTIDADQMKFIQKNVYDYFGVNEAILQNTAVGDQMDAFWNGAIEPFAIQLSEVLTKLFFTEGERAHGAKVIVSANRLQYMSNQTKILMAQQLGDRGMIMIDEIRELFNFAPLPDGKGQYAPIRGEYYNAVEGKREQEPQEEPQNEQE